MPRSATALVNHDDIDAVTFTGSTGVGRRIAAAAAARGVPVQAEMGGKNAAVVLDDADFDLALEQVMLGRVPVHRPEVHRHFTFDRDRQDRRPLPGGPGSRAEALIVGDPTDERRRWAR